MVARSASLVFVSKFIAPPNMTSIRSDSSNSSSRSSDTSNTAAAPVAHLGNPRANLANGRYVQTETRIDRDQDFHLVGKLSGQDHALHIAAERASRRERRATAVLIRNWSISPTAAARTAPRLMSKPATEKKGDTSNERNARFSEMVMRATQALRSGSSGRQ